MTKEVERLEVDIDETIKRDEEERQREQRSHEDQVATLKEKNADYKSELETLLSTPKKNLEIILAYYYISYFKHSQFILG
ncbi:MAG: hypothetical protein ACK56F_04925, partial [bacterium]